MVRHIIRTLVAAQAELSITARLVTHARCGRAGSCRREFRGPSARPRPRIVNKDKNLRSAADSRIPAASPSEIFHVVTFFAPMYLFGLGERYPL